MFKPILSPQDLRRIEETIAAVETRTAGELVVAVAHRSSWYRLSRLVAAALWAVGLALLVQYLWKPIPTDLLLLAQVPVALAAYWLTGMPLLTRMLVSAPVAAKAAHERAVVLFMERGICDTRDRSGLLIFVSELERRVVILGDSGIHAHIGEQGWQEHARAIIAGIRKDQATDAIVGVIEQLGTVLADKFPAGAQNPNELPNTVIEVR